MPLSSILGVCTDRVCNWYFEERPLPSLLEELSCATSYETWEETAFQLDELLQTDLWRQNSSSKYYDYRLIHERRQSIINAREEGDVTSLISILRSGLVRNLGNITSPRLFNRAYAGTKLLIEEYITQVALAIEYVTALPTDDETGVWTGQAKLDLLHDTRQAFGRSTLVLQGGGIFALCHFGVIKALHLRGLLPRIITGTSTGALIASVIAIHTEEELDEFLNGEGIGLNVGAAEDSVAGPSWQVLLWSAIRWIRGGELKNTALLEEYVRESVGELTFEEAYARTKRVLNITIPTSGRGGVPNLLNYLTAPNVLITSAALASNTATSNLVQANRLMLPDSLHLLCKDETGAILPWPTTSSLHQHRHHHFHTHIPTYAFNERDSPLSRIAELFNVNHFIVSQPRPFISPYLLTTTTATTNSATVFTSSASASIFDLQHPSFPRQARRSGLLIPLLRLAAQELHHRFNQLDALGILPLPIRRLLVDESVPPGASITLVPDLRLLTLLLHSNTPSAIDIQSYIRIGERCVWPNISLLRIRCAVEVELDRCYQLVRRRKPLDAMGAPTTPITDISGVAGLETLMTGVRSGRSANLADFDLPPRKRMDRGSGINRIG